MCLTFGPDPVHDFFLYHGTYYATYTRVTFKKEFMERYKNNPELRKHSWLEQGLSTYGIFDKWYEGDDKKIYYNFHVYELNRYGNKIRGTYNAAVPENLIHEAIDEITTPFVSPGPPPKKHDWDVEGMGTLWILYIAMLFFSFIFTQWYLIWFWGSIGFFVLRKGLLDN